MDDLREKLEALIQHLGSISASRTGLTPDDFATLRAALDHPERLMDKAALTALQEEAGRVSVPREQPKWIADLATQYGSRQMAALKGDDQLVRACNKWIAIIVVENWLELRAMLSAAPAPAAQDEYYWWCAGCQREVPQEEVGLDNKHTLCPNKLNRWRRAAPSPGAQSGSPDASQP